MIVLDASAVLELLLDTSLAHAVRQRLHEHDGRLAAPHLLEVEVTHVLRRYERAGELSDARARVAVIDLGDLPLSRYPHTPLLPRMWELRKNLTGYDAAYVALAEVLEAPLVTCDAKLAQAPGHRAHVDLIGD